MITPDDVKFAYQLFLGRDPENEDVINNFCQNTHSLKQLRDVFLNSPEFMSQVKDLMGQSHPTRHRHPFHLPFIPVETQVSDETLQKMFNRIQAEWEYLGNKDPYWSVVTQPKYHQDEFAIHSDEFYLSGHHATKLFLAALMRCGINLNEIKTCIEIGCGVGRVTYHLSKEFEKVIAIDISESHLAIAKNYLEEKSVNNVELIQWQSLDQLEMMPTVDAIHSLITFQHNPPPVMACMLRESLNSLRAGGVAFIQIPTYKSGYFFETSRYLNKLESQSMEMHFLPQREIFHIIDESNSICLEIREDAMVGDESIMLSNTFVIRKN